MGGNSSQDRLPPARSARAHPRAPSMVSAVFAGLSQPYQRGGFDRSGRRGIQGMMGRPHVSAFSKSNMPEDFKVVRDLGSANGCCNGGILIVKSRRTEKIFVEKKMNPEMVDEGFAEDEIDILEQLQDQSYIVDMEAAFVHPSRPLASIITEYCDFGSMEGLINRHGRAHESISEGWIWKVFHQMSLGLYVLHSKRILHLDLKPGNVLLKSGPGSTPDIKIADFGSACGGQNDVEGSHLRDRNFVSPDRMRNMAADVWGLGAILLCLCRLTRNPPRDRHGSVDRDTGLQYSPILAQAILGCMWTSARDRFSSRDLPGVLTKMNSKVRHTRLGGAYPIPPRDRMS